MILLIEQLPCPVLVLGDFNAHHIMWGSNRTDPRGIKIGNIVRDSQLDILNEGTPTRVWDNGESAIDLSIASSILRSLITWSVFLSPGDSDHCPINITFAKRECDQTVSIKQLNTKRAYWRVYSQNSVWDELLEVDDATNEEAPEDLYS